MDGKVAGFLFLGVCLILAVLLLTRTIAPLLSGTVFAVALVVFGGLSRDSGGKVGRLPSVVSQEFLYVSRLPCRRQLLPASAASRRRSYPGSECQEV